MTLRPFLAPVLACFFLGLPARAADEKTTPRHAKAGVTCFDCHKEEKPSKVPVADDSCMACHGDLPAMAAYTKALPVNPHATPKGDHPGPFHCTQCHHQHKPPVVKCLECHPKFKLTPK
ncbi:MAG: cytochrome c3 family protein [Holophaga sp.]|nr:cytochrome c3 family protein [Holophaga sp.]